MTRSLTDDRLAALPLPERERYSAALRAGAGYTDEHHATLAALQRGQRERRNTEGGYWIAETDPTAAHHAVTATLSPDDVERAVLATDGASDVLQYLGRADWPAIPPRLGSCPARSRTTTRPSWPFRRSGNASCRWVD